MRLYLTGSGFHHPEPRLTNRDLERVVATSDAWIREKTGIRERRVLPLHLRASDMGVLALRRALASARRPASDLDHLVCATSSPDTLVPSVGCHIARKLGIRPVAFDVNAACAGFVFGLQVLRGLFAAGDCRRAALVATENYTRFTDYQDRATCVYWGDAAAAAIVEAERPARPSLEVVDLHTACWPEGVDFVRIPVGGFIQQDGRKVKEYATRGFLESARTLLERTGVRPEELAGFVGHQANYRLLEALCRELGIPADRHWHTVTLFGNQGAAGAPATLARAVRRQRLQDGDPILVTVFGAGFAMGSALLRFRPAARDGARKAGSQARQDRAPAV